MHFLFLKGPPIMLSHGIDFRAGYYVNLGVAVFPKPVHKQYTNRTQTVHKQSGAMGSVIV